jgi:uncharacterized protein YndB with AHSA1/START domain
MKYAGTLTIVARGDREIAMSRRFDASRLMVFEAFTTPASMKRWMIGPPGTTLPVCEIDFRVGGAYRSVWRDARGGEMGAAGMYRAIDAPRRFVATERFDPPWYPGEAQITIDFVERDGGTEVTTTMRYESTAGRDGVLETPMAVGVTRSYDRLTAILEGNKSGEIERVRKRA